MNGLYVVLFDVVDYGGHQFMGSFRFVAMFHVKSLKLTGTTSPPERFMPPNLCSFHVASSFTISMSISPVVCATCSTSSSVGSSPCLWFLAKASLARDIHLLTCCSLAELSMSSGKTLEILLDGINMLISVAWRTFMVFIPMTCPALFKAGPPELPGLMAASVTMYSCSLACFRPDNRPPVRLVFVSQRFLWLDLLVFWFSKEKASESLMVNRGMVSSP